MNNSIFKNKLFYVMLTLCICILCAVVYINKVYNNGNKVTDKKNMSLTQKSKSTMNNLNNKKLSSKSSGEATKDKAKLNSKEISNRNSSRNDLSVKNQKLNTKSNIKDNISNSKKALVANNGSKQNVKTASGDKSKKLVSGVESIACFTEPVTGGTLLKPYSYRCQYSKTLEEYEIHPALDIKAKLGSNVLSAGDGMVKDVKNDERLGETIIIDNGNHLTTQYSNLGTKVYVKVGDPVKKGTLIGTIGKSSIFESADEPHLHFAVLRDNQNVDPANYFMDPKIISKYHNVQKHDNSKAIGAVVNNSTVKNSKSTDKGLNIKKLDKLKDGNVMFTE